MPNYCSYSMKVTGEPVNVREFIEVIQRNDHTSGRHFYRVFEAYVDNESTIDDDKYAIINGECAWSVHSCMMEGPNTYSYEEITEYKNKKGVVSNLKKLDDLVTKINCIYEEAKLEEGLLVSSLLRESRLLNLTIEVFSEEPGGCFEEHIVARNGKILIDESVHMVDIPTQEFETVEALNEEYKKHGASFTQEEFESEDYLKLGGFKDWNFDDWD